MGWPSGKWTRLLSYSGGLQSALFAKGGQRGATRPGSGVLGTASLLFAYIPTKECGPAANVEGEHDCHGSLPFTCS